MDIKVTEDHVHGCNCGQLFTHLKFKKTQKLRGAVKSSVWLITHGKYISHTEG